MGKKLDGLFLTEEEVIEIVKDALNAFAVTKVDGGYISYTELKEIEPLKKSGRVHGRGITVDGEKLLKLMVQNKLTSAELAELAGIGASTANRAVNSKKLCLPIIAKIADAFGVPTSEIVKEEN